MTEIDDVKASVQKVADTKTTQENYNIVFDRVLDALVSIAALTIAYDKRIAELEKSQVAKTVNPALKGIRRESGE